MYQGNKNSINSINLAQTPSSDTETMVDRWQTTTGVTKQGTENRAERKQADTIERAKKFFGFKNIVKILATASLIASLGLATRNIVSNHAARAKDDDLEQLKNPQKFVPVGPSKIKVGKNPLNIRSSENLVENTGGETNQIIQIAANTEFNAPELYEVKADFGEQQRVNGDIYAVNLKDIDQDAETGVGYFAKGADGQNFTIENLTPEAPTER